MKRKPGYYWVKLNDGKKWEPARFDGRNWWAIYSPKLPEVTSIDAIGRKIEVPK